jgi:hypothetical protein
MHHQLERWLSIVILGRAPVRRHRNVRRGPARDAMYLRWIRSLDCAVCGFGSGIEAAHTGSHGLGQKSSDCQSIPLCVEHHRMGRLALHVLGPAEFQRVHHINIATLVAELNEQWQDRMGRAA